MKHTFAIIVLASLITVISSVAADSITINNYNNSGQITVISDSGTLHNVQAIDPASIQGADPTLFPEGMIYFEVAATSANVSVLFESLTPATATYNKFTSAFPGSAPELYDFTTQTDPLPNGWVLHLREGGFGDLTGNDNLIVDPGGPRLNPIAVVNIPFSTEALVLLALLFSLGAIIMLKRKELL